MSHNARSDDHLIKKHFSVSNYDSVDEENVIEMDQAYLSRGQTTNTVFTPRNIALSTVFIGATMIAVANFPFNAQSVPSAFSKSEPEKNFIPPPSTTATDGAGKPNFVFILVDDVGYHSIGYDVSDIGFATPYLTELAQAGVILDNYYTQESCAPARAALLSGRYPSTVGLQYGEIHPTENFGLSSSEDLLPDFLRQEGYINYALGKWNLGHYHPQYLPTARGFDYFLGYMDGHNHYWDKKDPSELSYYDFMYSNRSCYGLYDGTDRGEYSTTLYKTKAVDAIRGHDFESNPMFMYLAVQAAHDPFAETTHTGLDADYVGESRYSSITNKVVGAKRQQYAMSLMMLDDAVREVHEAIISMGQKDNTYIIFASDNGGCYQAGGKNGPLRGSKGSLFEGGVKVNAFIHGEKALLGTSAGSVYNELMHVSDWFSTILSLASGTTYSGSKNRNKLDGVDHSKTLIRASETEKQEKFVAPRDVMLYNIYLNVDGVTDDENYGFAIRNTRYKLMHYFENTTQSDWYTPVTLVEDDDNLGYVSSCSQESAVNGDFNKYLFDLQEDPYEKNNLYNDPAYNTIKKQLYDSLTQAIGNVQTEVYSYNSTTAEDYWQLNDWYIQPFDFSEVTYRSYPSACTSFDVFSPTYGTKSAKGKHPVQ